MSLLRIALVAAAALLLAPTAALAHADYRSTSPKDGAVLESVPDEVSVQFDSGLLDAGAALVVTAEDGTVVSIDPPVVGDRSLSTRLLPDTGSGTYLVAFRVVSQDGHTVTDSFSFSIEGSSGIDEPAAEATADAASVAPVPSVAPTPAAPPAPTASGDESGSSGAPTPILLAGLALLAAAVVAAVVVVARRRRPG